MSARLLTLAAAALLVPAAAVSAQSVAARVAGVEGTATLRYGTRAAACGDGRDYISVGEFMSVERSGHSIQGRGRSNAPCIHGPASVTLTVRGGTVTDVRVRVGTTRGTRAADVGRDLGTVSAGEAAEYFLALAGRLPERAAGRAVVAAAVADSTDVWRPLLSLARGGARDERTQRTAMHWLAAVAPPEAVPTMAMLLRSADERRPVREGAAVVLALAPGGVGVPPLAGAARGEAAHGGGDPWVRERAVFWLGSARDERARATLRTLAAADTAPTPVREQAIFTLGHVDESEGNVAFLRALYPRLAVPALRDKVLMSVAQADDAGSRRWLVDLAADAGEPLEARKQALFWAGQQNDQPVDDLLNADARLTGEELRKHYTFVLSQRDEDAAVERLIAIARRDPNAAVRRQAIFWLGQSRNARARQYLESVVAR